MGPGVAGLQKALQPLFGKESPLGWGYVVLEGRSIWDGDSWGLQIWVMG